MSNLVALPAPEPQVNEDAVKELENLLAKVRAGDFSAVAMVAVSKDSIYTAASSTPNPLVLAGLMGAMDELKKRMLTEN